MKSIGSVLLSLTLIIFLTSCSSIKKIETFFTPVEREPLGLEEPVLGKLESIKWIVITSENAEEVFEAMKSDKKNTKAINLILLKEIGQPFVFEETSNSNLKDFITKFINDFRK